MDVYILKDFYSHSNPIRGFLRMRLFAVYYFENQGDYYSDGSTRSWSNQPSYIRWIVYSSPLISPVTRLSFNQ